MALITWVGGFSTNFDDKQNWSPQQVPGSGDDAAIDTTTPTTITVVGPVMVNSVTTNANVTLSVTSGSFTLNDAVTANDPTGTSTNAGTILVGDNTELVLAGTFSVGTLDVLAGGKVTGTGAVAAAVSNLGSIVAAAGGTLVLAGTVTGAGALVADGTLEFAAAGNVINGQILGTGVLDFGAGSASTIKVGVGGNVRRVEIDAGATFTMRLGAKYGGTLNDIANGGTSTFDLGGHLLDFTHRSFFEGESGGLARVDGGGTLESGGTMTVGGTDLDGGTELENSKTIEQTGALTLGDGSGGTGSVVNAAGAKYLLKGDVGISAAGAHETAQGVTLASGSSLDLGTGTLTVTGDSVNNGTGIGNGYNPDAGVTGTMDGAGATLAVVGVNGTSISNVNGTLTITLTPNGPNQDSGEFEIENTGAAGGATLRGALQTSVNGGSITNPGLSGNGVTAANLSPIAAGGTSGTFTINYGTMDGALSGQAIHIETDFANVPGITLAIATNPPAAPASAALFNQYAAGIGAGGSEALGFTPPPTSTTHLLAAPA